MRGWRSAEAGKSGVRRAFARFRAGTRVCERRTGEAIDARGFSALFSPLPSADGTFRAAISPFGAWQRFPDCGRADFLGFPACTRVGERTFCDFRRLPGWERQEIQIFGVSQGGKEDFLRFSALGDLPGGHSPDCQSARPVHLVRQRNGRSVAFPALEYAVGVLLFRGRLQPAFVVHPGARGLIPGCGVQRGWMPGRCPHHPVGRLRKLPEGVCPSLSEPPSLLTVATGIPASRLGSIDLSRRPDRTI